jgi:hypothetical protein
MSKAILTSTLVFAVAATSGYAVAMFQSPTWQNHVPAIVKQVAEAKQHAQGDPLLEAAVEQMEASVVDAKGQKQVESLLQGKHQSQPTDGAGKSSMSLSHPVALTAIALSEPTRPSKPTLSPQG